MPTSDFSGTGLLLPFQRDLKDDFANGAGDEVFKSNALLVLATEAESAVADGELEWRTDFGSRFYLLRQQRNTIALQALAEFYAREAFDNWLPELKLRSVVASRLEIDGRDVGAQIHIGFDPPTIASTSTPGGKIKVTVNISAA